MTTTMTMSGKPLHFPAAIQIDADGAIEAPPREELARIAEIVEPAGLLVFTTRLIRNVRKRRHQPRHCKLNRSRLELVRLCIERALRNEAAPGSRHPHRSGLRRGSGAACRSWSWSSS